MLNTQPINRCAISANTAFFVILWLMWLVTALTTYFNNLVPEAMNIVDWCAGGVIMVLFIALLFMRRAMQMGVAGFIGACLLIFATGISWLWQLWFVYKISYETMAAFSVADGIIGTVLTLITMAGLFLVVFSSRLSLALAVSMPLYPLLTLFLGFLTGVFTCELHTLQVIWASIRIGYLIFVLLPMFAWWHHAMVKRLGRPDLVI